MTSGLRVVVAELSEQISMSKANESNGAWADGAVSASWSCACLLRVIVGCAESWNSSAPLREESNAAC